MKKSEFIKKLRILCFAMILLPALFPATCLKAADKTLIFPIPQKMELLASSFILDENITIIIPQNPDRNDIFLKLLSKNLTYK